MDISNTSTSCARLPQCSLNVTRSGIFKIGAAHVQFPESTRLRILDRLPEKKCHSAEIVMPGIGATILIDHRLLIRKGDHSRDWLSVLEAILILAFLQGTRIGFETMKSVAAEDGGVVG